MVVEARSADIEEWVPWEAEQDMVGLVTVALADINLALTFAQTVARIVPVTLNNWDVGKGGRCRGSVAR